MSDNNSSTMMVALVAIIVIIALGFVLLRVIPGTEDTGSDSNINVDLPDGTNIGE